MRRPYLVGKFIFWFLHFIYSASALSSSVKIYISATKMLNKLLIAFRISKCREKNQRGWNWDQFLTLLAQMFIIFVTCTNKLRFVTLLKKEITNISLCWKFKQLKLYCFEFKPFLLFRRFHHRSWITFFHNQTATLYSGWHLGFVLFPDDGFWYRIRHCNRAWLSLQRGPRVGNLHFYRHLLALAGKIAHFFHQPSNVFHVDAIIHWI